MSLAQLYIRVIGIPFYQRHAGLFLFIFILFFGIVPGGQLLNFHLTFITAMLGSVVFMAMVSVFWLLYALKCFQFVLQTLQQKQNQFLYLSSSLHSNIQFSNLLMLQAFLYLPVFTYAAFVMVAGLYYGSAEVAGYVFAFNSLVCIASSLMYMRRLNRPSTTYLLLLPTLIKIRKTYPLFYIWQLVNEMKVIFMVTKFFSAIIIIAFLNGFFIETYDGRVLMLGFLVALTAHCVMVFEFRKFEESLLGFYRNLPVTKAMRWLNFALLYLLILIPEWLIFGAAVPVRVHPEDIWWLPFFGTGILLCYHCLLYKPPLDMERYLQWVFGIFAILFFLILYHLFLVIVLLLAFFSLFFFFRWYQRFELTEGQI